MNDFPIRVNMGVGTLGGRVNMGVGTQIIPQTGGMIYSATTAEWNAQTLLVAKKDAIYVYTDHGTVDGEPIPAIKVGDGTSYLIDMPFVDEDTAARLTDHIENTVRHITESERQFWNSKVSVDLDGEILILTEE